MSESALVEVVKRILAGGYDPVAAIVEDETDRGFKVVRPGDTPWFPVADWREASIASIDGDTIRLVLIHSHESGKGALTRMLAAIEAAGLKPTVLEPTPQLADVLRRRGWRSREVRLLLDRETVWSPQSSAAVESGHRSAETSREKP